MKGMAKNYIQIRQKPDTNSLLKDYLSEVNSVEDTLYAIIFMPMQCPRCEVAIQSFYRLLKEESLNMLLITAYPDSIAAAHYNKDNNNRAEYYLYDTRNRYRDIFSVNLNDLSGLHILKLCKSTGRMIMGGMCEIMNTDFVSQLKSYTEPLDFHDYQALNFLDDTENVKIEPVADFIKNNYSDYKIEMPQNLKVSSVYQIMRFEDDKFYYNDWLKNGVYFFTKNDKNKSLVYNTLIQADSLEKRKFIDIPEDVYQEQIRKGGVFYICLNPNQLDEGHVGISYSLPNIFVMDSANNNLNLAYCNAPAIIIRSTTTWEKSDLVELDFNIFDEEERFFYANYNFSSDNDMVIFGCSKLTWPIEFDPEDYMDIVELNPFNSDFYKTENPIMAAFDMSSGKMITRFGNLQTCHEKSFTGYYYFNPVSCFYGDEILFTDGFSGQLFVVSKDDLNEIINHYSLFEIDVEKFPPIDSLSFYTYEHVNPYNSFFYRIIEDIKLTEDKIYCLVRYGSPFNVEPYKDEYTFVEINRKNNKIKESRLPKYSDMETLGYGLKNEKNKRVVPFVFLKKEGNPFLRIFE
jgi:hypothetical protein